MQDFLQQTCKLSCRFSSKLFITGRSLLAYSLASTALAVNRDVLKRDCDAPWPGYLQAATCNHHVDTLTWFYPSRYAHQAWHYSVDIRAHTAYAYSTPGCFSKTTFAMLHCKLRCMSQHCLLLWLAQLLLLQLRISFAWIANDSHIYAHYCDCPLCHASNKSASITWYAKAAAAGLCTNNKWSILQWHAARSGFTRVRDFSIPYYSTFSSSKLHGCSIALYVTLQQQGAAAHTVASPLHGSYNCLYKSYQHALVSGPTWDSGTQPQPIHGSPKKIAWQA